MPKFTYRILRQVPVITARSYGFYKLKPEDASQLAALLDENAYQSLLESLA